MISAKTKIRMREIDKEKAERPERDRVRKLISEREKYRKDADAFIDFLPGFVRKLNKMAENIKEHNTTVGKIPPLPSPPRRPMGGGNTK